MKIKKHKQTRRHLRFYKAVFGIREPYKVLMDGNFLHALVEGGLTEPADALAKLLEGNVRPFLTKCVVAELKALGPTTAAALRCGRHLDWAHCGHEGASGAVPAAECLLGLVGARNAEHFLVGTQDAAVRARLRTIAQVPTLYVRATGPMLDPPTALQLRTAAAGEAAGAVVPEGELAALTRRAEGNSGDGDGDGNVPPLKRKLPPGAADARVQWKRHRVAGPNPLAVKKKKKKTQAAAAGGGPTAAAGEEGAGVERSRKKRPRRRKAAGGDAGAVEGDASS